MLLIVQHIELLLKNHDFVILPNIGGFVASAQAARQEEGTLYPPCKVLGFNPTLTYNDGLLAQSIAQEKGYSIEQANTLIVGQTQQLRQQLQQRGLYDMGTLGTLQQTPQGIGFIPHPHGLKLASSYGLEPVYFPTLSKTVPLQNPVAVATATTAKVIPLHKRHQNFAVACIAAILILLMIPVNLSHKQIESRATFVAPPAFEEVVIVPQSWLEEQVACTPYHVVIGSFNSEAKALKFLKELPSSLSNSEVIYSEGRFRIIAASFSTEDLGNAGIERIASTYPAFKDAWLLHYNP